jgi:hypothetical protein
MSQDISKFKTSAILNQMSKNNAKIFLITSSFSKQRLFEQGINNNTSTKLYARRMEVASSYPVSVTTTGQNQFAVWKTPDFPRLVVAGGRKNLFARMQSQTGQYQYKKTFLLQDK